MAEGGQPVYSPKLGWSKSPRFVSAGRPSDWSLGGPVVLTHTQRGSLAPGLYSFLGTPIQSLLTPPLSGEHQNRLPLLELHSALHGGNVCFSSSARRPASKPWLIVASTWASSGVGRPSSP